MGLMTSPGGSRTLDIQIASLDSELWAGPGTHARTAKQYINLAVSEVAFLGLPMWGRNRVSRGQRGLHTLIRELS